jgi:uncharacterized protein (DUF2252 family)
MRDTNQAIVEFNASRDPERLALKYARLRADAFAFLRGTAHLFYEQLDPSMLPRHAPLVWACGDLHLQNFGCFKGANRLVYFDLNDFDEAALAPVSWELVRMLASILVAGESLRISPIDADSLMRGFLVAYAQAIVQGKAGWVERETAQEPVRSLLEGTRQRPRAQLLDHYTRVVSGRRQFRLDARRTLKVSDEDRRRAVDLVGRYAAHSDSPTFYEVLDVARRIAGIGSLGLERYVVLVVGKGTLDTHHLIDVKRAQPSALAAQLSPGQPDWLSQAHRICAIQDRMQACTMAHLAPVARRQKSYVVRELQPHEDRLDLQACAGNPDHLLAPLEQMARVLAWDQLRASGRQGADSADALMAFCSSRGWKGALRRAARAAAASTLAQWRRYCKAYDQGGFKQPS